MFSLKPDYDTSKARYDAFWEQAIVDRTLVNITLPAREMQKVPERSYDSHEDRWCDGAGVEW